MAKIKAAGSRAKTGKRDVRAAIPCFVLLACGFVLLALLFYSFVRSA